MQKDLIARLKYLQIVHHGEVELSHGGASHYYIDLKKAYGNAEAFYLLAKRIGEKIPNKVSCIAGGGYGGLPLAAAVSTLYLRDLSLVRDEPKDHGIKRIIEGHVPTKEDKVAIVDDVFTTGKSLQKIIDIITPTRAEIVGCYVLVKRAEGQISVPVESLLRIEDLW
ncbi:orotate phosphoribosyltransferase [Candidatus Woesearchaeota archaeon]|nr:orotate phosphoribosyltransferase [Candidatus Woesearchaeota archaeon]